MRSVLVAAASTTQLGSFVLVRTECMSHHMPQLLHLRVRMGVSEDGMALQLPVHVRQLPAGVAEEEP